MKRVREEGSLLTGNSLLACGLIGIIRDFGGHGLDNTGQTRLVKAASNGAAYTDCSHSISGQCTTHRSKEKHLPEGVRHAER